jgi:uncharacterized protein YhfF
VSTTTLDEFWQAYLATLPPEQLPPAHFPAWYFGDSPELANELGDLVLAGRKSATCTLLAEFEHEHEPLPEPGERAVITRFDGQPLCIIATTGVEVLPFEAVNADFAYAEGEGDRSLASWRREHTRYFTRRCAQLGLKFSPDMLVVCERFRRIYPP